MKVQSSELDLRPVSIDPTALERYVGLFAAAFPSASKYSRAYLEWQYCRNPAGTPVGFDAMAGDSVVAHYVCIPVDMKVRGVSMRALLSLNTATHPDYQGRGLFTRLASATYDAARGAGYQFVYGVANANSTPGFLKKLEFQLVEPLQAGFVLGRLPRLDDDNALELAPGWKRDTLAWRLGCPTGRYHRCGSDWIAASTGKTAIESYAFASSGHSDALRNLPKASPARIRLFLGTLGGLVWNGSWLAPIPKALRPSPLNLIYRPLGANAPATVHKTRIGALEFDPY